MNSQPKADLVLELHRQGKEGINIWHCEVKGSRNTRKVKGYFLENPFHTVW
ncbi:conjugal transfer nickase/helicase domain-containing protein [Klebsiella pneumoniae]|uniref:conjugal transfer nickase/helicase domain-containing protein n=1 Tax=Klebsiella pneumoniae TaxID=573 RepID=UPI0035C7E365